MQSTISPNQQMRSRFAKEEPQRSAQRTLADFAVIFSILLILLLIAGTIGWQFWHVNRIYGGVTVANVAVGGLTRAQAMQRLTTELQHQPVPALSLTLQEQRWPIASDSLQSRPDLIAAVNEAYRVGRANNVVTRLGQQLVALLGGINLRLPIAYDRQQLQQVVATVAEAVRQPGEPARQIGEVTLPAEPGLLVDIGATTQSIWEALHAEQTASFVQLPLVVTEFYPATTPANVADTTTAGGVLQANGTKSEPGNLTSNETSDAGNNLRPPLRLLNERYNLHMALDPVLLHEMILSTEPLQLDAAAIRGYLNDLAAQINIEPRDARLRFNAATGGVTVLQESHVGRRLDVETTIDSIQAAVGNNSSQAVLAMVEIAPAVDMNRIAEMGIRELVSSGTSNFRGSSSERTHNIVVAAEKFDGLVIPPGGIFSFNEAVEDVTSANGFEDSLIILGDTTAVGVGGGVCQVSTTVFRAAYNAGFDIVERYNHGYVVSWYGTPGLDATIYTPTVDFQFRNNSPAYILIEPVVDTVSGVITFNFYGTKPDREVKVGVPQRSNVIEPEPPLYRINDDLAPGERRQVEWEQKGMTVSVERTITENGTTRTDTLTSVYQPWQAVFEVGPGTEIPATATPAPSDGLLNPNIAMTPTPSSPTSGP